MQLARKDYLAHMLRLWRVDGAEGQEKARWRTSLESPQTDERFVFSSLVELFMFLEQEIDEHGKSDLCTPENG